MNQPLDAEQGGELPWYRTVPSKGWRAAYLQANMVSVPLPAWKNFSESPTRFRRWESNPRFRLSNTLH